MNGSKTTCTKRPSHAQALIHCSRWADASTACAQLLPGVDQSYLRSELLWRQGELPAAVKCLEAALRSNPASSKCSERLALVQLILEALQAASSAMDAGNLSVYRYTPSFLFLHHAACLSVDL